MCVLQEPCAVALPFAPEQSDRFRNSRFWGIADGPKVLQRPQNVILPADRKGELQPILPDDLTCSQAPKQPPFQKVLP